MPMTRRLVGVFLPIGLLLTCGQVVLAQDTSKPGTGTEERGPKAGPKKAKKKAKPESSTGKRGQKAGKKKGGAGTD